MPRAALLLLLLCLAMVAARAPSARGAAREQGAALLIANSAYAGSSPPSAAAQTLGAELSRLGFSVTLEANLRPEAMRRAIDSFAARLKPGAPALFYFSGFGIDAKGSSYLIPVGAEIWTEADVRKEGVPLALALAAMEKAGARPKIVILDASRRNPYERRFRTLSAGLAAYAPPPQTLLISAAEPGKVVDDADDGGLFVSELVKELRTPDSSADDMFRRTRLGVLRATGGHQVPEAISTLTEPFFFRAQGAARLAGLAEEPAGDAPGMRLGPPADLAAGSAFRDCPQCPSLVIVPAGEFTMGSDEFSAEQPVRRATIAKPFAIGRFEVTVAQWDACLTEGGCAAPRPQADEERKDAGGAPKDAPVSGVSFSDARRYLDWLSRKTGRAYRLPSETEWEYAARAGAASRFWWGDAPGTEHANCRGCGGPGRPTAAGSYPANGFGLYDTAGNVAEWVADCWADSYAGAPRDGSARTAGANGEADCRTRVARGGSFDASPRYVRSASRFPYDAELRYYTNGLRVARDLP